MPPTRLGDAFVMCWQNADEVEGLLVYCPPSKLIELKPVRFDRAVMSVRVGLLSMAKFQFTVVRDSKPERDERSFPVRTKFC